MPDRNIDHPPASAAPASESLLDTAAGYSIAHDPVSSPPPLLPACICEAETQRIIGNFTQSSSHQPPATSSTASLPETLKMAHALVKHWGDLNGCPNAGLHLDSRMLCSMTDAIEAVLPSYEVAVGSVSSSSSSSRNRRHNSSDTTTRVGEDGIPKALIGELELEPVERAIVAQAAVKHSILRLAAVLQDIEEEAALAARGGEVESPLRDRGVKELITRLFRLLGTVNQIGCTDNMD
ncbi:hypothetical protein F4824DRAFT_482328 [Ustulina deusta]|nr:hypothetical protein F4824DRAFT_482328 [Ustulina deusta]